MPAPSFTTPPTAPSRNDAAATFISRANAFLAWLVTFATELISGVSWFSDQTVAVAADAATASSSAATATAAAASAFAAPGTSGTSVTTAIIGAGAKTLTIQANKDLVGGMWVLAADAAAPSTNSMAGQIDSYDDGTGVLNFTVPADLVIGSGSCSSWTVSLTGPPANAAALAALTKRCTALALIF